MFIVYLLEYIAWGHAETSWEVVFPLWPVARAAAAWQMRRANRSAINLPDHLTDTYDGLFFQRYNASTYSAFFHLLAMRAAAALARIPDIGDEAFAQACDESYAKANASIQAHLWDPTKGYYRAYTNGSAVMADSLYAQVLADSLGLGTLTSDAQVRSHLKVVARENGTPHGLLVMTGRYPYPGPNPRGHDGDNSVWMMANANWATLSLWRGGDVDEAFAMANQTLGWWRSGLKDMWNVVALHGGLGYGLEGQPLLLVAASCLLAKRAVPSKRRHGFGCGRAGASGTASQHMPHTPAPRPLAPSVTQLPYPRYAHGMARAPRFSHRSPRALTSGVICESVPVYFRRSEWV